VQQRLPPSIDPLHQHASQQKDRFIFVSLLDHDAGPYSTVRSVLRVLVALATSPCLFPIPLRTYPSLQTTYSLFYYVIGNFLLQW